MASSDDPGRFRGADYLTGDVFSVVPTPNGWWETEPVPNDLAPYYPKVYFGERGRRFPRSVERWLLWLYRRRALRVGRAAGSSGKVLDVGCGPGHLLDAFRSLGWMTIGTEATEVSAAGAREHYGLEILTGELGELELKTEAFDAVVSWHSLEHMRDPIAVLDQIARVLKTGGVLLVSVPDFSSAEAQAKPSAWFHLDVPRHLAHIPASVLRRLLRARGFVIEDESFMAAEYDVFSLVQTWQNRLGLPHNLLYLILKSASGSGHARPTRTDRLVACLLALAMAPAAILLTLWRTLTKSGAVIVLLARKGPIEPRPSLS